VPESLPPLIMVVDDSLTVRKVSSRLLEREGYRVITAKDGIDALEKLTDNLPAAMLVDIEMPRMDGFDLTLEGPCRCPYARYTDHHDHVAHRRKASAPTHARSASMTISGSRMTKRSCCSF
jgi:DNA-binding NtrC family response regulator